MAAEPHCSGLSCTCWLGVGVGLGTGSEVTVGVGVTRRKHLYACDAAVMQLAVMGHAGGVHRSSEAGSCFALRAHAKPARHTPATAERPCGSARDGMHCLLAGLLRVKEAGTQLHASFRFKEWLKETMELGLCLWHDSIAFLRSEQHNPPNERAQVCDGEYKERIEEDYHSQLLGRRTLATSVQT